jgi:threonylcarbamoyladenosine tRNA methylthiotransferase MtaB
MRMKDGKVLFKTIGCKTNQYETQLLREQFLKNGFRQVKRLEVPDVCLINTCTVTAKTDKKTKKIIKKIISQYPGAKVIATGCGVDNPHSGITTIEGVDLFIGNEKKNKVLSYIKEKFSNSIDVISSFSNRDRAFVKIQNGCDNYCSYCIVPYARGKPQSRSLLKIEEEAKNLIGAGYKELVLVGTHLGFFGQDRETDLPALLDKLISIKELGRLRLSSIEPNEINQQLISRIKNSDKICRHLHLPIQSADDRILKKMNRKYKMKLVRSLIERLIKEIPEIGISCDLMAGFPGEDDNNFKKTLNFIKKYDLVKTHVFSYSDRKQTAAYNFKPKVSKEVKTERALLLKKASLESAARFKKKFLKKELEVLVEEQPDKKTKLLCGYTDNYIRVNLINGKDYLKGRLTPIQITLLKNDICYSKV